MTDAFTDLVAPGPLPRLMHIMISRNIGGAETFFTKLAREMHARGVPTRVVTEPSMPWTDDLIADGIDTVPIAFGGLTEPLARARLRRAVNDFRPDAVLAYMGRSAKRLPRRKGGDTHINMVRYGGYFGLKHAAHADHAIGLTPALVDYIAEQGMPRERVHLAVNFGGLTPTAPVPRASLDTPEGVPLVLALGRFVPKKGFDTLLRALAGTPDHHLWLGGIGDEEAALKAVTAELGIGERVRFLGWRQDRAALLAAADMCCVPSRSEPFGSVVVESWITGCPLVATRSEGPGWMVSDGEDGLLVDIDDVEGLGTALMRVANEEGLAARLAAAGRATHDARFSADAVCARYVDLIRTLTPAD